VLIELTVTVEELLNKIHPVNMIGVNPDEADERRYNYAMSKMQEEFPGNYILEEYYNPTSMSFRYRLKFLNKKDEMWFKLKYQ
jgi:hypothetical protein